MRLVLHSYLFMAKSCKPAWIIFFVIVILCALFVCIDIFTDNREKQYQERNEAMLSDKVEIERKWLIDATSIVFDKSQANVINIEQTYISFSPEIRVRKLNNGQSYTMTVKDNMTSHGMTRDEYEVEINQAEYEYLVKKQEGNTIYKTRYELKYEGYLISIDIFSGELNGLAYLEVEFLDEQEAQKYKAPSWVIKEVTNDLLYKNGSLARYGLPESFYEYTKK